MKRNVNQKETEMLAVHCLRTLLNFAFSMWHWLKISPFNSYRPELYYMRGGGPKWQEKEAGGRCLRS
jgi:hypothetical protein